MTYGQQLIQRGLHQGLQQGLHQGMQQGLQQGLHQGLEQGLYQGIEQGAEQKQQAIAKKMLLKGHPIQEIADLTDLSLSKIKQIKAALPH